MAGATAEGELFSAVHSAPPSRPRPRARSGPAPRAQEASRRDQATGLERGKPVVHSQVQLLPPTSSARPADGCQAPGPTVRRIERATGGEGGLGARAEPTPGRYSPGRQCRCGENQNMDMRWLSELLNQARLARNVPLRGACSISELTHPPPCQGMTAICALPPSTGSPLRGSSLPQRPYDRAPSDHG